MINYIYNNVRKTIRLGFIYLATVSLLLASCMDNDWDIPSTDGSEFGNQSVTETNVVSIEQLKQKYATVIYNGSYVQFTEPTQIKGVVTGNDIQGNLYSEVAIEDGTGSMIICISQGGLFGQMQVGREILVELNGLYIGSYGQQPEIGTPYTNSNGRTYVSRMSRTVWQQHYKLLGMKDVSPVEFDKTKLGNADYMERAVKRAIRAGILSEYLTRKNKEVENMYWGEYDYATDVRVQRREAYNQGISEGIATGAHDARLETARNYLGMGLSAEQVAKGSGIPLEQVRQLQKQ